MHQQLDLLDRIPLRVAREQGEEAGAACLEKAERTASFDSQGAGRFIVGWLVRFGPTSGESLVKAACEHGYRPHDMRAFGPVFKRLANGNQIRALRSDLARERGNGTSGGRLWGLAR